MTPSDLAKALATPNVVITLPDGDYGDLKLIKPATIRGGKGAVFNSVSLSAGASGSTLEGFTVALKPTPATNCNSSVVMVNGANNVMLRNLAVRAGPAVSGVPETYTPPIPDSYGSNVIGWPTSRGITVQYAKDVTIEDCDVSACYRGLILIFNDRVSVVGNTIHDTRTSPISAAATDNLTLARNVIGACRPWGWGNGQADHGDFIHVWTDAKQTKPTVGLQIVGNLVDQGEGAALLGFTIQDPAKQGYAAAVISGNVILNGNNQGMRLENVHGVVSGNVMLQTSGLANNAPSIILANGSDPVITGNASADSAKVYATRPGNMATPPGIASPLAQMLAKMIVQS